MLNIGRMVQDGIPYADLHESQQRPDTVDWFDFWTARADVYEALGDQALRTGHTVSAGEWLWLASLNHHYAQGFWWHEPERRQGGQARKVELCDRAAPYLVPPAERVEIPFRDTVIAGYLRLPRAPAQGPFPCAVLLGGLESTKEESHLFENLLLERGVATFAFDGPGQGEMWATVKLAPDFEAYTSKVVDYLETRSEIDAGRLGVLGRSLGGHYALKSAAAEPRFKACVCWGGFFDIAEFDQRPPLSQQGYAYVSGKQDLDEAREYVQHALDCAPVIDGLRAPTYVHHGRLDAISMRQMTLIEERIRAPKTIVVEDRGDHCCHNLGPRVRLPMADWLAEQLGAR